MRTLRDFFYFQGKELSLLSFGLCYFRSSLTKFPLSRNNGVYSSLEWYVTALFLLRLKAFIFLANMFVHHLVTDQ